MSLKDDIQNMLNQNCRENESNTPDFILARYLIACLVAFEEGVKDRENWYGKHMKIGDKP